MSDDFDPDRRQRQRRSDDRFHEALGRRDSFGALREVSTSAALGYLNARNATDETAGSGAATGSDDLFLVANQSKLLLLQNVARQKSTLQAAPAQFGFLQFAAYDPAAAAQHAHLCLQFDLLYQWIADTDLTDSNAEPRLRMAASNWISVPELHAELLSLAHDVRRAQDCLKIRQILDKP